MHPALADAIEGLYVAFADYPAPKWIPACPCCHEPEDGRPAPPPGQGGGRPVESVNLRPPGAGAPLREIGIEAIAPFVDEFPYLLAGDERIWKHYLPRILELSMQPGELTWNWAREAVIGNLRDNLVGPWFEWPDDEATAVRSALHGYWLDTLDAGVDPEDWDIDDAPTAIGLADPDIDWYLDEWQTFRGRGALPLLAAFVERNLGTVVLKGRLDNAFWGERDSPMHINERRIVDWLRSEALADAVLDTAARTDDPDTLELAETLLQRLTVLRENAPR